MKNCSTAILSFRLATPAGLVILFVAVFAAGYLGAVLYVLQLLDCLKDIDKSSELNMEECGRILSSFAQEHHITKELADRYITLYPLEIYKAIYDTGVQYVSS